MADVISPIEIAPLQAMDENFSGCNIGSYRNIVHIAKAEKVHIVGFMGLGSERIPEEKEKIHFIAGDPGSNLLISALGTA